MVQTINVPAPIDLTAQRLAIGDRAQVVTKINTTQEKLEVFATGLTQMASDLSQVAGAVETQSGEAKTAAEAAAASLLAAQQLMDTALSPAIDAAIQYINDQFSDGGFADILSSGLKRPAAAAVSKADPVVLNSDGAVAPVGIDTGTVGPLEKITQDDITGQTGVFCATHNTYLFAYRENGQTKFSMVGVNGDSTHLIDSGILFTGSAAVWMWEDADGNIDVFLRNTVSDYSKYYAKIIVTAESATVQPLQNIGLNVGGGAFEKGVEGKFLFLSKASTPVLTASVISVSNAVATVDYSVDGLLTAFSFQNFLAFDPSSGKFVFGYVRDSVNYINTITPDYVDSFALGTELNVHGLIDTIDVNYNNNHLYFSTQVGKLLLCNLDGGLKVRSLDTSGAQVSLGLVSEFRSGSTVYEPYVFFDPIINKHIFFWVEPYGTGSNYCFADYSNGTFNFETPIVYDSNGRDRIAMLYNHDVGVVQWSTIRPTAYGVYFGSTRVVRPAGTNAANYIGVAKTAASSGGDVSIAVAGDVADGFSGLTINASYWLAPGGGLQPYDTGLARVGRAVTDNSILVGG